MGGSEVGVGLTEAAVVEDTAAFLSDTTAAVEVALAAVSLELVAGELICVFTPVAIPPKASAGTRMVIVFQSPAS